MKIMPSKNTACLIGIVMLFSFVSCTIVPPKMNMTGEKTVIERQITGNYSELEQDAWIVSSVKTLPRDLGQSQAAEGFDSELVAAINIREFHRDKIERYKTEGAIGEAATGFIVYRSLAYYEGKKSEKDILQSVIKNENDARNVIFHRSLFLREQREPLAGELESFRNSFAAEQRSIAKQGDWIQDASGKWAQK